MATGEQTPDLHKLLVRLVAVPFMLPVQLSLNRFPVFFLTSLQSFCTGGGLLLPIWGAVTPQTEVSIRAWMDICRTLGTGLEV